ncbi:MAG: VCBS repeat-containing protein [bacterium]
MMRLLFSPAPLLALLAVPSILFAQEKSNLIQNAGFERSLRIQNVWKGISGSGTINAPTESAIVLGSDGVVGEQIMPVSVAVADLNKDGLNDIAIMDGQGFLRIHFNSGTKENPKFGPAEFCSLHLNPKPLVLSSEEVEDKGKGKPKPTPAPKSTPRPAAQKPGVPQPTELTEEQLYLMRSVQRINLADINRSGKFDLLIGNYGGDVLLIPNSGSPTRPDFRNPPNYESAVLQKGFERWGNVFAPYAVDWDKDGKMDLLVGEASYSANSIHIFPAKGIGRPSLEPDNRSVLAYGMGLEQLSPCVVDYNGDGNNDLLVAERGGKIAVYLGKGGPFKPGEPIPFDSFITIDGAPPVLPAKGPASEQDASLDPMDAIKATNLLTAGGGCTLAGGDLNGDGLFDLVFGKRNGRVAISLNQGTATQPKFKPPVDLNVEDQEKPMLTPSGWDVDFGYGRGNFGGYITVVKNDPAAPSEPAKQQPSEGAAYLEAGYMKLDYKGISEPAQTKTKEDNDQKITTPNVFTFSQDLAKPLKVGKTYILSFRVKGAQINNGKANLIITGIKKLGTGEVLSKDERGAVKRDLREIRETQVETAPFSGGSNWVDVKKEFTVKFENKDLNDIPETKSALLRFIFQLTPGSGIAQFDDLKLVEK